MSHNIIIDMHVKIFFLIFQFVYYNQYYSTSAEPLIGSGVRRVRGNEFPFVVSIGTIQDRDAELNHICTGSLISRIHVLTAAHCMDNLKLGSSQVSIGSSDLRAAEKFPVSWWVTYDDWLELNEMPEDARLSDIVIIKLSRSVDNPRIAPATLSLLNSFTAIGLTLNVAGWGVNEERIVPRFLRTGRVHAISTLQCSDILSRIEKQNILLASNYMCTQGNPPVFLTCGDSGGPVFTDDHQIVAINKAACLDYVNPEDRVNVHLVIDDYRHFITDVIRSENDPKMKAEN